MVALHGEGGVDEVVRGEPLEDHGGSAVERDAVGHTEQLVGVHDHELGVRAGGLHPDHAVARGPDRSLARRIVARRASRLSYRSTVRARPDLHDGAAAVRPHDVGERHRVRAGAAVGVDEVHPGCGDADQDLAGTGDRVGEVGELEDVGAARLAGLDRTHGPTLDARAAGLVRPARRISALDPGRIDM
ncbi:hypothetical protein GCM10025865_30930 [Paraoerskovia sediminicola]|uniref:Uncharacterized protein n=1 Tax=Paraoerskovia sediminicola TaxID=1138587 RepID=A0ABM8G6T1_9CELL|nr:hypothetical protein GCM10025865_30930 [Paraoerskovia sediminicola]